MELVGDFGPCPPRRCPTFAGAWACRRDFCSMWARWNRAKICPTCCAPMRAGRPTARPGAEVALVLAGAKGWHYQEIFDLVAELQLPMTPAAAAGRAPPAAGRKGVYFPGFVPEQDLCLWYNAAAGFVYPSLFEGFGLPVVEAMASGAPVICSDAPSLQEVAGDAALIVPAQDQPALQNAFERLFTEQGPRRAAAGPQPPPGEPLLLGTGGR